MNKNRFLRSFISLVAVLCLVTGSVYAVPLTKVDKASAEYDPNVASIVFETKPVTQNIVSITPAKSDVIKYEVLDGKNVLRLQKGSNYPYVYIDLANSLGSSKADGSEYEFEVEYYDQGKGYFFIWYDSIDYGMKCAQEFYFNGTFEWKTVKFTVDDAKFARSIDGKGDLMISIKETGISKTVTPDAVNIRSIKIKRIPAKNPVLVESTNDEPGNIFAWYKKDKIVTNTVSSKLDKKCDVTVVTSLVNTVTGDVEFEDSRKVSLAPKQTKSYDVNLKTDKCALYKLMIKVIGEDFESEFEEDTIAIVKTDPDGIRCEFAWTNMAPNRYEKQYVSDMMEIVDLANLGGVRLEISWREVETQKGKYSLHNLGAESAIDSCLDKGIPMLLLLSGGNTLYGTDSAKPGSVPNTEELYDGFENFCRWIMDYAGDICDFYEILNEPNISSSARDAGTGKDVAEVARRARIARDEMDPTAAVGGLGVTEIRREDTLKMRDEALENGLADPETGMTAMVLHTYAPYSEPENTKIHNYVRDYSNAVEAASGIKDIPIAITEYGYNPIDRNTGIENAANWNVRTTIIHKHNRVGDYMVLHTLDARGQVDSDREDNFGLTSTYMRRYAREGKVGVPQDIRFLSWVGMNYVLGGNVSDNGSYDVGDNVYIRRFKSDKFSGKDVIAMWGAFEDEYVTMDLGVDNIEFYDDFGNKTALSSDNGIYTFRMGEQVSYLVGNFKNVKVLKNRSVVDCDVTQLSSAEVDICNVNLVNNTKNNYTIEAVAEGDCTVEGDKTFKDGKATVTVNTKGEAGTKSYVHIYIKNGNKVAQYFRLPIIFGELFEAEVSAVPVDADNLDKWKATVTLKNNSMGNKLTNASVEFYSTDEFKALGKLELPDVDYASTGTLDIDMNFAEKGFKNIAYKVIANDIEKTFEQRMDLNVAAYAKSEVVLDGDNSEWPTNIAMKAESPTDSVNLDAFEFGDASDKSANVSVMWDEDYLYLYSEVTDNVYFQDKTSSKDSWAADGLQLGLYVEAEEDDGAAFGEADSEFTEIAIAMLPGGNKLETWRHKAQDDHTTVGLLEGATGVAKRKGNITTYEWKVSWKDLTGIDNWSPYSGFNIGFSILWNDNDGEGRKGWIEYASGVGMSKDRSQFTYLYFMK